MIQFYPSEFGGALEHPSAFAIRIHERRKVEPGYCNRGSRRDVERRFNAALEKIYFDAESTNRITEDMVRFFRLGGFT